MLGKVRFGADHHSSLGKTAIAAEGPVVAAKRNAKTMVDMSPMYWRNCLQFVNISVKSLCPRIEKEEN
jgi:hypothetical protein